jgi:hypothetical protein
LIFLRCICRHGEGDRGAVPTAEFVEQVRTEIAEQLGR